MENDVLSFNKFEFLSRQILHDILGQVTNVKLAMGMEEEIDLFVDALVNQCELYRAILTNLPNYEALENFAKYKEIQINLNTDEKKITIQYFLILCILVLHGGSSTTINIHEKHIEIKPVYYENIFFEGNGLGKYTKSYLEQNNIQLKFDKSQDKILKIIIIE